MPVLKIKIYGDACQIVEQTERIEKSSTFVYKTFNGKNVYCYDYPDYIPTCNNIYLRGTETDRDHHVFGYDREYLEALDDFCKHFKWRFVIYI